MECLYGSDGSQDVEPVHDATRPGRASQLSTAGLHALIQGAPDGIFVSDIDGKYIYANDAACRMLGYSNDEIIGKTIFDLIAAHDVERLQRSKAAMLEGKPHVGEWTLRRKDGSWLEVEVNANILPDGQWQAFVRDISERKSHQAEREALFERMESDRRWLQTVLDTLPLGVLLFQPGGKVSANKHAEQLLGLAISPESGVEQYANRIFFPDGRPVPPAELMSARMMRSGKTIVGEEHLIRRPDGTQIPLLGSAAAIRDEHGRVIGGVGVFQDVSDRMRLEQAVRENERLLQAVFDILPVGVWVADEMGIESSNPAAERIWAGVRHVGPEQFGEYKGWWADSGKPIAPQEWAMARAIRLGETSRSELIRIQCFDGSFKTIINWAAPIRAESGEITGAVAVNEDVTALHQTQEQLRTAVRDREDILAVVTHDLRNPLNALLLTATCCEQQAARLPGGEPLRAMAASIAEVTRSMSALVSDLLAIAVARPGYSMLDLKAAGAASLVAKAAEAARPLFERNGIRLEVEPAGELPLIHIDSNRILRVISNLLDNALKFTEPHGRVVLRTEAISGAVRFCVDNSGPALGAADIEGMFQPFWQAGREDRRGAGLGLSICRSIVDAHGGSIWAEPATGMRVRVCFVLPCAGPAAFGIPADEPGRGA